MVLSEAATVKFTGKHLCQSVFFINLQALMTSLLILTCKTLSLFFLMQDNFVLNKEFILFLQL